MASTADIQKAFSQSGIGRAPTDQELSYYSSFPDAGKVEGDIRSKVAGGNSGNTAALSAPDLTNLEDQVYQTLKPYYLKLAQQAQGDYSTAVKLLNSDYTKGVRDANANYAFAQTYGVDALKNTLSTLGVTNLTDQTSAIDKLNGRGFAVGQNGPNGEVNALRPSAITANQGPITPGQPIDFSSNVANPANPSTVGQGGLELSQLQQSQQLRQEAEQRAALKPIEQAGIQLKQYTNTPAGVTIDPSNPSASLANLNPDQLGQLGSAEQGLVKGSVSAAQTARDAQEQQAQNLQNDVFSKATALGSAGIKEAGNTVSNLANKTDISNFVTQGVQ